MRGGIQLLPLSDLEGTVKAGSYVSLLNLDLVKDLDKKVFLSLKNELFFLNLWDAFCSPGEASLLEFSTSLA